MRRYHEGCTRDCAPFQGHGDQPGVQCGRNHLAAIEQSHLGGSTSSLCDLRHQNSHRTVSRLTETVFRSARRTPGRARPHAMNHHKGQNSVSPCHRGLPTVYPSNKNRISARRMHASPYRSLLTFTARQRLTRCPSQHPPAPHRQSGACRRTPWASWPASAMRPSNPRHAHRPEIVCVPDLDGCFRSPSVTLHLAGQLRCARMLEMSELLSNPTISLLPCRQLQLILNVAPGSHYSLL